nr:MAG TPA: hypothetical protein [Caudoviricetes sp.]
MKKVYREYSESQSMLNEEEMKVFLKRNSYKICDTKHSRHTTVNELWTAFNEQTSVKEKITKDGLIYAIKGVALENDIVCRTKNKTIQGKQYKVLTNIYKYNDKQI